MTRILKAFLEATQYCQPWAEKTTGKRENMLVDVTQSMNCVVLLKAQLFQIKPESRSKEPNLEFRGRKVFSLHGNEIGPVNEDEDDKTRFNEGDIF